MQLNLRKVHLTSVSIHTLFTCFFVVVVVWLLCTFQDFEEAYYLLVKSGVLQANQQEIVVTERGPRTLGFLTSLLDPFLQGYQVRGVAVNAFLFMPHHTQK